MAGPCPPPPKTRILSKRSSLRRARRATPCRTMPPHERLSIAEPDSESRSWKIVRPTRKLCGATGCLIRPSGAHRGSADSVHERSGAVDFHADDPARDLHIGNIPYHLQEDRDLFHLAATHGPVLCARVVRDRVTGR